jgi:hypothetical protein
MALTTSAWARPIQGVSQQPPKIRLEGQASIQENAISSVVTGLRKRPGTVRIGTLTAKLPESTAYHYYNRGTGEEYIVAIPPNSLPRVFDISGEELVVENNLLSTGYIFNSNPLDFMRFSTISDFTFIVNKTVIPLADSELTPALDNQAIINVQFADYGRTYSISLNGTTISSYTTPDGSEPEDINDVDTSVVAERLYNNYVNPSVDRIYTLQFTDASRSTPDNTIFLNGKTYEAVYQEVNQATQQDTEFVDQFQYYEATDSTNLGDIVGYEFTLEGNTILVRKTDSTDFDISTTDGADGRDLFVVKNLVKQVTDLPVYAPVGYRVEVVGQGNNSDDNYWLVATENSGSTVRWVETQGPEQSVGLDVLTMPVVLIRDRFEAGKAVFIIKEGPWEERGFGTEESNPMPSFVQDGVPLTSIGTLQNRLSLTAGESVIHSRSNQFFDFFRSTVRTALDTDPIDVYADTNKVNFLENSAILDGDRVFFSRNGQFLQSGRDPITKSNATLQFASTFENIAECPPVASGDVIFFAFAYGRFSGIREFYTDSFTDTKRARPVTDHVDEYILGRARQLATSTNKNQLLVLAEDPSEVYVYNWLWQGEDRVQSSWSKWIFEGEVQYIAYDNDTIYILINREGNLELERIETGDPDDNGLSFSARLDRRFQATAVKTNGQWDVEIPYGYAGEELALVRGDGCFDSGVTITFSRTGQQVSIEENIAPDDVSEVSIIGGIRYKMVYQPTMPFIKDRAGKVIDTDRLIINDVNINYDKTGLTQVVVENEWGVTRNYEFNSRVIGGFSNIIGFAPILPGKYSFPIRQESEKITFKLITDSHIPFQLRDMEWRGRFTQRGRRV